MRNYLSYVFLLFLPILGIGLILGGIDEVETLEGETWAMTSQNEVTDFSDQFQGRTAYLSVHDGTADSNDFANSFFRSNPLNTTQIGDVAGNLLAPNEECTWTVRVWEDYFGDEVDWELRDSDGTVILSGGDYGYGYDDIQTATAEGPLTFWITNDGFFGDNEANYEVSNSNGVILTGQMPDGGATYTFDNLNCEDEALAECSGIPEGGTATINPDSGPSGSSVNFTVSDYTTDLGITYDWEFSADDGTIWQSVGVGDDDVDLIVNGLHGDELLVRYAVTCTNSGETAYSNVLTFTIDNTNCTPSYSASPGDHIESFVLEDISNLNSGKSTGGYGDFTSMSTDLTVGETYTATLTSGSGSGTHAAAIWIDFNDDGFFEPSEKIGLANDITANSVVEIELEIPADAELGSHTMRVVYQWNVTAEDLQPCASASYGEGEDYTVVIVDENGGEPEPGDACFEVDFSDIVNGHSNDPNGSGTSWNGNDDFPTVERAYQAGGAVKLGTGSAIGFIESRDLTEVEGDITVNLMVKGWTNVEGDLIVSIDGQSETLSYTAKMADDFEMITASFEGVTAGSNLRIETSAKRAFIDNVEIICEEEAVVEGCLDAPYEQYPGAVYQPVCVGVDEMIVLDGWSGEYSLVALTSGVDYTFKSSITTDYITISNAEGTEVLAVGEGVVEFTASADMEVRFYTHVNDQCEMDLEDRARIVFCGEVVVIEEPDFECLKGNGLADTEIEDGYGITEESQFRVADKFVVDEGMEMEVHQITLDVLTLSNISNSTINLREDLSGTPGEIIETITIQPTEAIVHNVLFGYPIYHLVYDLDESIVLGEGTYWIEPSLTSEANNEVYWALIPSSSTEANLFLSDDFGETWVEDDENFSTMFFVAGVCTEATEEPEDCEAVDVPYIMDFETAVVPDVPECTSLENAGSGNDWVTYSGTNYGFTGTHLRYSWNTLNDADAWFYTQGINLVEGETYKISYDYGGTGSVFDEKLKVAYGIAAESTAMTTVLADHPEITNDTPINHEVIFTVDESGVYYFGFNAYSEKNKFYLHLDNIEIVADDGTTEPEPGDDCSQGIPSFATVPNANGITIGEEYRVAEDFTVEEGTTFTMNQFTFDMNMAELPNAVIVYIHEDEGGYPGAIIETINMLHTSSQIVGSAFGD